MIKKTKILVVLLSGALTLSLSGSVAQAATYSIDNPDVTQVGGLDSLISQGDKLGSTDAEQLWVQNALGDSTVDWTIKVSNVSYFQSNEDVNVYAFETALEPDYFLIKNATKVALFENMAEINWGVFDSSLLSPLFNIPSEGFSISHVTSFSGSGGGGIGGNPVPAPGSLGMFGAGLAGLVYVGRKSGKRA